MAELGVRLFNNEISLHRTRFERTLSRGCSSYLHDTAGISATVTHTLSGRELTVTATITNNRSSSITIVDYPDFWSTSIYAKNRKLDQAKNLIFVHFVPAGISDVKVITAGDSYAFKSTFGFRRVSQNTIEIYDGTIDKKTPYMKIWDDHLKAYFHYDFYPDYFPWIARFGLPKVLATEIESSEVFSTP